MLDHQLVTMVYQPIVDLRRREVFGYEALCRPLSDDFATPEQLVRAAVVHGRVGELGRLQRRAAVQGCPDWPLFVNIEPSELDQAWLVRPDDAIFRHRRQIYVEITETVPLKFFEQCHSVLGELRGRGVRLVVDDLGAGFSNLKYIAELEPDVVKLDRGLVAGAWPGSAEFDLLESIVRLCHRMSARVVAEGVESHRELEAVLAAGADYCQGYYLARPGNPPPPVEISDLQLPAARPQQGAVGEGLGDEPQAAAAMEDRLAEAQRQLAVAERDREALESRLREMTERMTALERRLEGGAERPPLRRF